MDARRSVRFRRTARMTMVLTEANIGIREEIISARNAIIVTTGRTVRSARVRKAGTIVEGGAGRIATTAISEITAIEGTEIGAETVTARSLRTEREIIRIVADVAIIAETVSRTHNRIWNKNDKSTGEDLCF